MLLVNGRSSIGAGGARYGHNIIDLYETVKAIAADLLPRILTKPNWLTTFSWRDRTPEDFLRRLYDQGNADNRYLLYGYAMWTQDPCMLDAMVFAIRRLIVPLDEQFELRRCAS